MLVPLSTRGVTRNRFPVTSPRGCYSNRMFNWKYLNWLKTEIYCDQFVRTNTSQTLANIFRLSGLEQREALLTLCSVFLFVSNLWRLPAASPLEFISTTCTITVWNNSREMHRSVFFLMFQVMSGYLVTVMFPWQLIILALGHVVPLDRLCMFGFYSSQCGGTSKCFSSPEVYITPMEAAVASAGYPLRVHPSYFLLFWF